MQAIDPFEFLVIAVLTLFPFAFLSFMILGYRGQLFSEYLSIFVADGWCTLPEEGIGSHCFGDYGFPRSTDYNTKLFSEPSLYLSNTPLTILFFIFIQKLSYNVGLVIYLLILTISVCMPVWLGSKSRSLVVKFSATIFLGLLSIGSITSIDRGNHVVTLLPLVYLFLTSKNKKTQIIYLFLIINLKFWGLIFLIVLISQKRFKDAVVVVTSSIVFNFITLQLLSSSVFTSIVYAKKSELALAVRFAPTIICTFLLVPEAPIYQISMIIILISLLAHDRTQFSLIESKLTWSMIFPLIISTIPLAIDWAPTLLLPPQRFFYWLYPLAWISVMIYFMYIHFISIRNNVSK